MEAIVSVLILGMLLTTIVSIIRFSMVMTGNSIRESTVAQEIVNSLVLEDLTGLATSSQVLTITSADDSFSASFSITLYNEDNIVAFYPAGGMP